MYCQNLTPTILVQQIVVVIHQKKPLHKTFPFWSFWVGLVVSIVFFTYFEVQNYNSENQKVTITEQQTVPATEKTTEACCTTGEKCE